MFSGGMISNGAGGFTGSYLPDTDATASFGRAKFSSVVADFMTLSHFDTATSTNYALGQNASGATIVNAASGQNLSFAIAGSSRWRIGGTNFELNDAGTGKWIELTERTDPSAPSANTARFYCRDNGAGKTQLVAIFNTGAVQVIATEP